ncbi:MAG TPA: rhodanese-like domain-containing protein [Anaerolineales bacterium]|nr:rhodanese-like domain-containing protein [Anaerolineales bacterium]
MKQWIGFTLLLALLLASCGTTGGDSQPKLISVDDAHELYQNGTFFIDVRTQEEWNEFHAPNSVLIPLDQLQDRLAELPDDQLIVVVCRSGNRSEMGRDILLEAGFKQVTSMEGGLTEWAASGYPIENGP